MKKEITKEELLKVLLKLDVKLFVEELSKLGFNLPKQLRVDLLKSATKATAEAIRLEKKSTGDELAYRLGFHVIFGEYQLQILLPLLTKEARDAYYSALLDTILEQLLAKKTPLDFLDTLSKVKAPVTIFDLDNDAVFNPIFVESDPLYLDNLSEELVRPVLYHSSTTEEIKALGKKYGVSVPLRFKKKELIERILLYIHISEEEKEGLSKQLETLPPVLVERFAKDNNIKVSTILKKEEVIEYIIKELNKLTIDGDIDIRRYYFTDEQKKRYGLTEVRDYLDANKSVVVDTTSRTSTTNTSSVEIIKETVDVDLTPLVERIDYLSTLVNNTKEVIYVERPVEKQAEEAQKEEAKSKIPGWLKVILYILLILVFAFIFLCITVFVYAIVTQYYKGPFQENLDSILNKIHFGDTNFMDWLREVLAGWNIGA